tara:strand:+ start:4838 stop:5428 length:591 start_codon:yes stop_codon:yes gene_type:complete
MDKFMINIILFGPPGSGKGTQAQFIVESKELTHISTGDIFRKNIHQKTTLGNLASSYMNEGKLVPDQVTIDLLESEIDSHSLSNGFIFDGFPRTIAQAHAFELFLKKKNMHLSLVISLEVSEDELIQRLLKRGLDSGRRDDSNQDIIRNRIQVYNNQTSVLKNHYQNSLKQSFFSIDGERSIDLIARDILNVISEC